MADTIEISDEFVKKLMQNLRVKNDTAKEEVRGLVYACIRHLDVAGVYVDDPEEPLCYQAIRLYCKWQFGYDEDTEKFMDAYLSLRDSMALSGDYATKGAD